MEHTRKLCWRSSTITSTSGMMLELKRLFRRSSGRRRMIMALTRWLKVQPRAPRRNVNVRDREPESSSRKDERQEPFRSRSSRRKDQESQTRSTKTRGSQTLNGRQSPRPHPRSLAPRGATTSTLRWDAVWGTSAGSSTSA